ncbi:MAG: peroxiredoxin-like family protein [Bryobacteraceae bacterium]|nr:peroxiredoxin-like family protein [Bryobacteraceae bacterium]
MSAPRWMKVTLALAGLYNLVWGASVVLFPGYWFEWAGMAPPNYPELWQCVGMIVGVYGIGYVAAATNPLVHWPIVLVGLLGKILGPIGFAQAAAAGRMPWQAGWTILTNDLVWWIPFGAILWAAYRSQLNEKRIAAPEVMRMAMKARTQQGVSVDEISRLHPVLLVFLRHAGCTFCREALADLAKHRKAIEESGTRIVLVSMSPEERLRPFLAKYGLDDLPRVSDSRQNLYRAFGLRRGGLADLFGPKVWIRGFEAGILARHGVGWLDGDGFQMPGVFVVYHGEVIRSYRHQSAADRPNYLTLVNDPQFNLRG